MARKQGLCWLKVTADHYIQFYDVDPLWKYQELEDVIVYTGTRPKLNPDKIVIILNPTPWERMVYKLNLRPLKLNLRPLNHSQILTF